MLLIENLESTSASATSSSPSRLQMNSRADYFTPVFVMLLGILSSLEYSLALQKKKMKNQPFVYKEEII